MKKIFINKFKKSLNTRGSSYLEFLIVFVVLMVVFFAFMQIYWLLNAQTILLNTTRTALRQVEVEGTAPSGFRQNITNILTAVKNISDVEIIINDNPNFEGSKYQLRRPIKLTVKAKYNLILVKNASTLQPVSVGINLSSTYVGSSQRYFKELGEYIPVTE